jgi:hypothetical protein
MAPFSALAARGAGGSTVLEAATRVFPRRPFSFSLIGKVWLLQHKGTEHAEVNVGIIDDAISDMGENCLLIPQRILRTSYDSWDDRNAQRCGEHRRLS